MGVPFATWYVSDAGIDGLRHYRYSGADLSLTSKYVMQHYWRWAVNFLPRTLAPNLVTLCGFACLLTSYFLVEASSPELRDVVPAWVWVMCGLCLFAYQTLDALDGKQARRTGTSSPLGELFDHGCDALGTHLISLNTVAALLLPEELSLWALCYVMMLSTGFYFCAWEQYHTGTLTLGYVNGPVDGILFVCGIYFATAYFGNTFWCDNEVYGLRYAQLLMLLGFASGVFTFGGNIFNVVRHWSVHPEVHQAPRHPIRTVAPGLVMLACVFLLYVAHYDYVSGPGFRMVCCAYGMAVGNSCGWFIISRVCNVLDHLHPGLEIPTLGFPVAVLLYVVLPPMLDAEAAAGLVATLPTYMTVYLGCLVVLYLHMALSVCERIGLALGINSLSMTDKQIKKAYKMAEKEKHQD
eukprot:TRINITY_DN59654_c0_g1_i1.p1 TRINITY_DN59654_c0_g1~~TRINITY_DN59654_c0_g1_i1.p1  ORF type:complete len:422 (+),score=155.27 TRINITY_DN59654_c0_g1_i1:41-1267(+)